MGGRGASVSGRSKSAVSIQSTPKYTKKQLDTMKLNNLKETALKVAVEYYTSGKSGISFGGRNVEDVAKQLVKRGTTASLKKDILSMQKRMKK